VWWKFTNVSEVLAASIIRATARASETMVNFYQTTLHYNPKDSHLLSTTCFKRYGRRGEVVLTVYHLTWDNI
jgi:hypothetical protein